MTKLKMNQCVPNNNADLLKKIGLMGTELVTTTGPATCLLYAYENTKSSSLCRAVSDFEPQIISYLVYALNYNSKC